MKLYGGGKLVVNGTVIFHLPPDFHNGRFYTINNVIRPAKNKLK